MIGMDRAPVNFSSPLRCGFDQGGDGAAAIGHAPIGTIGVDLIPLLFGFYKIRREYDTAAGAVRFDGVGECCRVRNLENGLEHLDHVLEGMLVVVQNDDVIELRQFIFCTLIDICV